MSQVFKYNRVALFSSYFTTDNLPFYIKFYLEKLKPHTRDIIFITNDDKNLNQDSIDWLKHNTSHILLVKNEGYDFGMWQKALNTYDLSLYEEIILCNDSCICFAGFDHYFNFHHASTADITGMTLSNAILPHLQSYFLTIKKSAVNFAINYIKKLELENADYMDVVSMGEIGLSLSLRSNQYKLDALFKPAKNDISNPTYAHCVDLINAYSPLIKKKLLKEYEFGMMFHLWDNYQDYRHSKLIENIKFKYSYKTELINALFSETPEIKIKFSRKFRFYRKLLKINIKRHLNSNV